MNPKTASPQQFMIIFPLTRIRVIAAEVQNTFVIGSIDKIHPGKFNLNQFRPGTNAQDIIIVRNVFEHIMVPFRPCFTASLKLKKKVINYTSYCQNLLSKAMNLRSSFWPLHRRFHLSWLSGIYPLPLLAKHCTSGGHWRVQRNGPDVYRGGDRRFGQSHHQCNHQSQHGMGLRLCK